MYDVSFSRGFKWFVILLLPLTLVWKVIARVSTEDAPEHASIQQRVNDFLLRQHFSLAPLARGPDGTPIFGAISGPCRMLISPASPMAWERDAIRRYAKADDRVFVVFGGKIYDHQPTWLTVPDFLWGRLQRELGRNIQPTSILTVIADPTCEADRLPWSQLG